MIFDKSVFLMFISVDMLLPCCLSLTSVETVLSRGWHVHVHRR